MELKKNPNLAERRRREASRQKCPGPTIPKPSAGARRPADLLVVIMMVMIMVMMMLKMMKIVFIIASLGFEVWEASAWSAVEF